MLKKILVALIYTSYLILIFCAAIHIIPGFLSMETRVVLSGSMEPTCPVGSLLLIRPCSGSDVSQGDILTFTCPDGTVITHRVETIHPDRQTFVTKGDANEISDFSEIPYSAVIGRPIFMLPWLGYVLLFLETTAGHCFLICFIAGSMCCLLLSYPWKGSVKEA